MAHLSMDKTRAAATPPEWLKLAAQIAEQCNTWAAREDIVGYVGPGAGGGQAPACFRPSIAEMEVCVEVAFGEGTDPTWVGDFTKRKTHFDYPVAAGAVLHEAAHARWSLFPLESVFRHENRLVAKVAEYFEETRIEGLARKTFPRNRGFLRACALKLVLGDLDADELKEQGGYGLSLLVLLSLARVDAGVLEEDDVIAIREIAEAMFGVALLEKLRDIWLRAQAHADHTDGTPLIALAEEWMAALTEGGAMTEAEAEAGAKGEPMPGGSGAGAPGGEGEDGEGESSDELGEAMRKALEDMLDALEEAAEDAAIGGAEEAAEQEMAEAREVEVAQRGEVAREVAEHKDEASKMFAKGTGPMVGVGTSSRLVERRAPSAAERTAAVKVSQLLEKARYQDRVVTPIKKALPPGRLNTRAAVAGVADIKRVGMTNATPWRAKSRKHTEDPELKMGVLVDISGSMGAAMTPMAVTAWVFSEAARRIQAKCAMTYFGQAVFPVLKPGQHLPEVQVFSAPDGTEKFDKAFKVTDGALNLLHGSGARLLVICSDMCYTGPESAAAQKWVKRLIDSGVAVVIMTFDSYSGDHYTKAYKKLGATVIGGALDPAASAVAIGKEAAKAIEAASARRAS